MNQIWSFLLLLGIGYGLITGRASEISTALLDGASNGITLCITMLGIIALWSGILEIAEKAGMVDGIARHMKPMFHHLFPRIPENHPALRHIATNFTANILGLGWAATPAGLKAMEELAHLERERWPRSSDTSPSNPPPGTSFVKGSTTASPEMSTFLILNISSLQLIPMTMIAYRAEYGSSDPTSIIGPAILATSISTLTAILFCRIASSRYWKV